MKPKNTFTIVNRSFEAPATRVEVESSLKLALSKRSKELGKPIGTVPPALMEALISNSMQGYQRQKNAKSPKSRAAISTTLPSDMVEVVKKLSGQPGAATVGILDLGAWVSGLPRLLRTMNKAQDMIAFLEVQTPVPAGLIKTKEPLIAWAQEHFGRTLTKSEKNELTRNMLADEFYYFAESVRTLNKLDILIGLTPAMIAFLDTDGPAWNYYAAGVGAVSVVSTCDLREFSEQAGRPYEAAIGMLIAGQVLALRNDLEYHKETIGCIFDFNEVRSDIVKSIKGMMIDPHCMSLLKDAAEMEAARSLIAALSKLKRPSHG